MADVVNERAPILGSRYSSFRSLTYSLLEPNVLVLIGYLTFNVHLAIKVFRIATKSNATATIVTPVDGPEAEIENDLAPEEMAPDSGRRSERSRSDTKATELLVKLSSWAFANAAQNAKRITAILAIISLVSTWHYMLSYLQFSYRAYLARCHLTGYPLPPVPPPFSWDHAELIVPSLHLRILRISQWLGSLSLFEEAWLEVVRDRNAWWWSSEICIVTVGSWALFLRSESKRLKIPHVWAFMALGQLVAISFAYNLFQLAVIYRLNAEDLVPGSTLSRTVTTTIIQPAELSAQQQGHKQQRREMPRTESELLMPPPLSTPSGTPTRASTASTTAVATSGTTTTTTTTTVQRIPLAPRPFLLDRFGALMARVVPERVAVPALVLGGLRSVFSGSNSLGKVLVMHVFPMLLVLYPIRRTATRKLKTSAAFGHPILTAGERTATARFVKSKKKGPFFLDEKLVHLALALSSLFLRIRSTLDVVSHVLGEYDLPISYAQRVWRAAKLVYPQTFHRHPAVSSIGSDHLAVLASVVAFILLESGLWIWKDARTSPSAHQPPPALTTAVGQTSISAVPRTVVLDNIDRARLEFQSRFVILLAILAPFWGASTSLGFYLALRETWIEEDEQYQLLKARRAKDRSLFAQPHGGEAEAGAATDPSTGVSTSVSDKVVGRLLESEEGERVLEIRQRQVSVSTDAVEAGASAGAGASSLSVEGQLGQQHGQGDAGHESDASSVATSVEGGVGEPTGSPKQSRRAGSSTRKGSRSTRKSTGSV